MNTRENTPFLQMDASDYGIGGGGTFYTVLDGKVRVEPSITLPRLQDYPHAHQIEDSDPDGIQVRDLRFFPRIFSRIAFGFPEGCFFTHTFVSPIRVSLHIHCMLHRNFNAPIS